MTERSVTHSTFVIEREYDASPARVFSAFTDPDIKSRWFGGPDNWTGPNTAFDFRVGGRTYSPSCSAAASPSSRAAPVGCR